MAVSASLSLLLLSELLLSFLGFLADDCALTTGVELDFLAGGSSSELESSELLLSAFRLTPLAAVLGVDAGFTGEVGVVLLFLAFAALSESELLLSSLEESAAFRLTPCAGVV